MKATDSEIAQFRALAAEGLTLMQAAERMGWKYTTVFGRAAELELRFRRAGEGRFTPEQEALLRDAAAQGCSASEAAAAVGSTYEFVYRWARRNKVVFRLSRAGAAVQQAAAERSEAGKTWRWTPDEDLLLRAMVAESIGIHTAAARLGRSWAGVHGRAKLLGLSFSGQTLKGESKKAKARRMAAALHRAELVFEARRMAAAQARAEAERQRQAAAAAEARARRQAIADAEAQARQARLAAARAAQREAAAAMAGAFERRLARVARGELTIGVRLAMVAAPMMSLTGSSGAMCADG
jgi:hypothetical protein